MIFLALAASLAAQASDASTNPPQPAQFADDCAKLQGLTDGTLVVTAARDVPQGPAPRGPSGPNGASDAPLPTMPHHCQIEANLEQRVGAKDVPYHIGMELRIPADWNGRFLYQGGGGMDGMIVPAVGSPISSGDTSTLPLARGFAVVTTDSGHQGKNFDDVSFADDQQAKLDYGYAAIGKVADAAKHLITRLKGKGPDHSYFVGCSNGGREAMVAAQQFPNEFDGVLAGNPAFHLSSAAVLTNYSGWAYHDAAIKLGTNSSLLFSPVEASLIQSALLKTCDGLDGAVDGMIFNHDACHFDVRGLKCRKGQTANCLDPIKVQAIEIAYRGPVNPAGEPIAGSWTFDTANFSSDWLIWQTGIPTPAGPMMVLPNLVRKSLTQYFAYPQYNRPLHGGDAEAAQLLAASARTAAFTDAVSTQYSSFAGHGGKLMVVTGWSDPVFSASDLAAYYERLTDDMMAQGGDAQSFSRLFLVPGMTHCGGGRALDDFDALSPLVDWVEKGQAPSSIPAKGKAFPGVERPICAYPKTARYDGQGALTSAASFACASPGDVNPATRAAKRTGQAGA